MQAFFEIHSYNAGFKPELVPGGVRPSFIPEPAGPKSNELELGPGQFAVEFDCTRQAGKKVVWIGYYTAGLDKQLGARGNYSGVGVWLVDMAPIYVERILKFLCEAALIIQKNNGPNDIIRKKLREVSNDFADLRWCIPLEWVPSDFMTEVFSSTRGTETAYLIVPEQVEFGFSLVAADILQQFTRKHSEGAAHRRLYLQDRSRRVSPNKCVNLDLKAVLASQEQSVRDFCEITAEPNKRQNELIQSLIAQRNTLQHSLDTLTGELATQKARNDQLSADLALAQREKNEILGVFNAVSTYIPNIGTAKRHTDSDGTLESSLLNDVYSIALSNRDEIRDLSARFSTLANSTYTQSNTTYGHSSDHTPAEHSLKLKRHYKDSTFKSEPLFILAVGTCLVLVFLALMFVPT